MGGRDMPDPDQTEQLYRRLVLPRFEGGSGDPLIWFAYLQDREALIAGLLDRVRREKHAMIAEAVENGMTYQAIGHRVGVNKARVMQLLRKAQRAERGASDA